MTTNYTLYFPANLEIGWAHYKYTYFHIDWGSKAKEVKNPKIQCLSKEPFINILKQTRTFVWSCQNWNFNPILINEG